jgi:tetratricopeptide (TPR) repeat protein
LFSEAILEYNGAKEMYPYLKGLDKKISAANSQLKIAEKSVASKVKEIDGLLVAADNLFSEKKYEEALIKYSEILSTKPDHIIAKVQAEKIDNILIETNDLIEQRDKLFDTKDYQNAFYKYEQAKLLHPFHTLINLKISQAKKEIEKINSATTESAEAATTTVIETTAKDTTSTTKTVETTAQETVPATTPAPETIAATTQAQTSGYFEIFSFSGNGIKSSESFTINGSKFKIAYNCSGDLSQAFLYKENGDLENLIVNTVGSAYDETIFHGSGTYYIEANMIGDFTMVVYDYR